jgi:hypothetical protein
MVRDGGRVTSSRAAVLDGGRGESDDEPETANTKYNEGLSVDARVQGNHAHTSEHT